MSSRWAHLVIASTVGVTLAACGGSETATPTAPTDTSTAAAEATQATAAAGIRVVSAADAAATIDNPPANLVILDVRTPEEFDDGHIDGAVMLDFYSDDFAAELAKLDPDVPYVVYCRSGNRSGQTRELMRDLGFRSVDDVDGGVISWQAVGLPLITK